MANSRLSARHRRVTCSPTIGRYAAASARTRSLLVEGAGCYGRNGSDDCSSEAALIATEIGRPVRLQWMLQTSTAGTRKGPATVLDYRAMMDDQGAIAAWEADLY